MFRLPRKHCTCRASPARMVVRAGDIDYRRHRELRLANPLGRGASAMGFLAWLRRKLEPPSSRQAVEEHEWGEVREWVEHNCRNVQWYTLVEFWPDLEPIVDQFLAASVDAVVAAYPSEPVPWLVLRFNPLTGMLSVVPAPEPSWAEGGERVELSLSSSFWEMEAERIYNAADDGS